MLGFCFAITTQAAEKQRPNVIYISVEDMWPTLGCYGDTIVHSPNIDRFAKEAVLFDDAHCQVALCTPSRTSILTGIRPSTSGIVKIDDNWREMLPNATSLPRHLRNNGYRTILAGKIYDARCGGMDDAFSDVVDEHALYSNENALKALQTASSTDEPFFLAIGYANAHDPWTPQEKTKQLYASVNFSVENREPVYKGKKYTPEGIRQLIRNYYGEITDVDSLIGELLDQIKKSGLFENSIILIGAMDHGYSLGYHGHWGKGNCYDDETHVPLMIRIPGNENNGKHSPALVELVDIYPTIVDLCRLPQPQQKLEGTSLKKVLENPDIKWKKTIFSHRAYAVDIVGVKTHQYNLIDFAGDSIHLYDRSRDPENLNDISGTHPRIVHKLMKIKQAGWQAIVPE